MLREISHFQDRREAIQAFDDLWKNDSPWILAFNGVSGQGKSTLLDWLVINRCKPHSVRHALLSIGDHVSDEITFLSHIVEAETSGFSNVESKKFLKIKTKVLDDLAQRKFHLQQSQVSEKSPDSQQIMSANVAEAFRIMYRHALSVTTDHWLACMRTIPRTDGFVLLLDNYDWYQDRASLDEIRSFWTTMERARQFLPKLRIILASREVVRHQEHVEILRRGLSGEGLGDLSPDDSRALLEAFGVNDAGFIDAVYRFANGHPLITRMAAEAWNASPDGIPAGDVPDFSGREQAVGWLQNFIMNRLDEPLRSAAQWMVVLRWFSFEALNAVLDKSITEEVYRKLMDYSFVVPSKLADGYKAGHDLVRKVQIAHLRREQPANFVEFNKRAVGYFQTFKGAGLEALYHRFFTDADEAFAAWQELESQAAFRYDHQLWGLLFELALRDELSLPVRMRAQILFRAGRRHYYRAEWFPALESYNEALKLFKEIGDRLGEANVLQSHGKLLIFNQKPQEGLQMLQDALNIYTEIGSIPSQANIYFFLGQLLASNGQKEKALELLKQAVELGNKIDPNHPVSLHMKQILEQVKNS